MKIYLGLNKRQKRRFLAKQRKKQLYESNESDDEDEQSTTPPKKAKINDDVNFIQHVDIIFCSDEFNIHFFNFCRFHLDIGM